MSNNDILITNASYFFDDSKDDVKLWSQIYKIIPHNVGLVDRNNTGFKIPYRMTCPDYLRIPTDLEGFDKTFEQCCLDRAQEILDLSIKLGVKIGVFYSGGVDSTGTLVSFFKIIPVDKLCDHLIVFMNNDSISENPTLFYEFIRFNCNIVSSERFGEFLNGSVIFTNGEGADQLFGTDMMIPYTKKYGFNAMFDHHSEQKMIDFFGMFNIPAESASKWYSILLKEIKQAPIELNSMLEMFWWFNFNFKWNSCFYRMMFRADENNRKYMTEDFALTFNQPFYMSSDFQRWAMLNNHLKIQDTWASYKYIIKEFIYSFNKDDFYRDNKSKVGSLRNLFLVKYLPPILTDKFEFILDFNKEDFYIKGNSFE